MSVSSSKVFTYKNKLIIYYGFENWFGKDFLLLAVMVENGLHGRWKVATNYLLFSLVIELFTLLNFIKKVNGGMGVFNLFDTVERIFLSSMTI